MVQYLILIVRYEWEFPLEANTELLFFFWDPAHFTDVSLRLQKQFLSLRRRMNTALKIDETHCVRTKSYHSTFRRYITYTILRTSKYSVQDTIS